MSLDNTKRVPLLQLKLSPTAAGTEAYFGNLNNDFLVHGITVWVLTAGVAATHEVNIESDDGATEYASIVVGTSAAKSLLESKIASGSRKFDAGTQLRLQTVNNESTGVYVVTVWGAPAI